MSSYAHPASIQTRVGECLRYIELNLEQQDMRGMWNFVRLLQRYTKPYVLKVTKAKEALDALVDPYTLDEGGAFDNMLDRVEICLSALHEFNIYGYSTPAMGSADGLVVETP